MRASGPGQSALLLLDVIGILISEKIEYAVVGAMAASVYVSCVPVSISIVSMAKVAIWAPWSRAKMNFRGMLVVRESWAIL